MADSVLEARKASILPDQATPRQQGVTKADMSVAIERWEHSFNTFCETTTFHGLRNVVTKNNSARR